MSLFLIAIYFGGILGSHDWHRSKGWSRLASVFLAICWPYSLGWILAVKAEELCIRKGVEP